MLYRGLVPREFNWLHDFSKGPKEHCYMYLYPPTHPPPARSPLCQGLGRPIRLTSNAYVTYPGQRVEKSFEYAHSI